MATRTLSFRLPVGWPQHLDSIARQYHFASRGEMLRLVLIEATCNALRGKLKVKGTISPPTAVLASRLPVATLKAIRDICCKQLKDTPSVWAGLVVYWWYQSLQKEDAKQQKGYMYALWVQDYAKNYRNKVARLQYG